MKNALFLLLLFCTTKSIAQWTQISTPTTENLIDIYFLDENIGYCIGLNGTILKTNNSGETWDNIGFNNHDLKQMYFLNSQTGIITNNNNIYKTINGIDFTDISFNFNIVNYNKTGFNISFKDNFGIIKIQYINSNDESDGFYKSYKTFDFGNSWQELDNSEFNTYGFYYIIDINTYYFVWSDLKKTINAGVTWETIPDITFSFPPFQKPFKIFSNNLGIATLSYNYDFLTLDLNNNSITSYSNNAYYNYDFIENLGYFLRNGIYYRSTDYGITINEIDNINVDLFTYNIVMVNENLGFACGDNGVILKITNASQLSIEDEILEKKIKISPNPTQDMLTIHVAQGISLNKITLYNSTGQTIRVFKKSERRLDLTGISTGNYILNILTNKGRLAKKIIVD